MSAERSKNMSETLNGELRDAAGRGDLEEAIRLRDQGAQIDGADGVMYPS